MFKISYYCWFLYFDIVFDNVSGKKITKPAYKGNDKNRKSEDTGNLNEN